MSTRFKIMNAAPSTLSFPATHQHFRAGPLAFMFRLALPIRLALLLPGRAPSCAPFSLHYGRPSSQKLPNRPGLRDTPPWSKGRVSVKDFGGRPETVAAQTSCKRLKKRGGRVRGRGARAGVPEQTGRAAIPRPFPHDRQGRAPAGRLRSDLDSWHGPVRDFASHRM